MVDGGLGRRQPNAAVMSTKFSMLVFTASTPRMGVYPSIAEFKSAMKTAGLTVPVDVTVAGAGAGAGTAAGTGTTPGLLKRMFSRKAHPRDVPKPSPPPIQFAALVSCFKSRRSKVPYPSGMVYKGDDYIGCIGSMIQQAHRVLVPDYFVPTTQGLESVIDHLPSVARGVGPEFLRGLNIAITDEEFTRFLIEHPPPSAH